VGSRAGRCGVKNGVTWTGDKLRRGQRGGGAGDTSGLKTHCDTAFISRGTKLERRSRVQFLPSPVGKVRWFAKKNNPHKNNQPKLGIERIDRVCAGLMCSLGVVCRFSRAFPVKEFGEKTGDTSVLLYHRVGGVFFF